MRFNRAREFVCAESLDEPSVPWPPPHDRAMTYFVPVYVDETRCVLKGETVDHFPTPDQCVYVHPIKEGTAYAIGTYGDWWGVDDPTPRTGTQSWGADKALAVWQDQNRVYRRRHAREVGNAREWPPLVVLKHERGRVLADKYECATVGRETLWAKAGTAWPAERENCGTFVREVA